MNDAFRLYAASRFMATDGAAENAFGSRQMAWLQQTLAEPPAAWNVLVSSVSMAPMVLDFTNPTIAAMLPPTFPDVLRQRLLINVDQWDGFPEMRAIILGMLRQLPNPIVIGGDIHGTFVVNHQGVYEFTGPAISSESLQDMVLNKAESLPQLASMPGLDQLVTHLDQILQLSAQDHEHVTPADIVATDTASHGYLFVTATPDTWTATLRLAPDKSVDTSYYDDPEALDTLFYNLTFELKDGTLTPVSGQ
jgi:alkaline phosphatase D